MTRYAVHNYHTPAIAVDPDNPRYDVLGEPLHIADSFNAAELWRQANRPYDPTQRVERVK